MSTVVPLSIVYLIPTVLQEEALHTVPSYVLNAVKDCQVFFVENERTARRFLRSIWKEMVIDDYTWVQIHKAEAPVVIKLVNFIKAGKNIGIISEAGCPGVADPGQLLIAAAHAHHAAVKPLVGPNSILLALMASGLNGQHFEFLGYLPIDATERTRAIRQLESASLKKNCTQIFMETPYRNNQLLESILENCLPDTWLSVAADLTSANEWISTKKVREWKKDKPDLHKRPAIFCLLSVF